MTCLTCPLVQAQPTARAHSLSMPWGCCALPRASASSGSGPLRWAAALRGGAVPDSSTPHYERASSVRGACGRLRPVSQHP